MATTISDLNIPGLKIYDPKASSASAKPADGTSTTELQANFLKMLTVQLQNQDPMNPMDNAQMTSQLAQLNMVDGINTMNKSMTALMGLLQASEFMAQSATVGRGALIAGNEMSFDGTNPVPLAIQFSDSVTKTEVRITDASGNVVRTVDLGPSTNEMQNLYWDGLANDGSALPAGTYRLSVVGMKNNTELGAQTYVARQVAAVGRDGTDIALTLSDGKKISPKDIVQWVMQ